VDERGNEREERNSRSKNVDGQTGENDPRVGVLEEEREDVVDSETRVRKLVEDVDRRVPVSDSALSVVGSSDGGSQDLLHLKSSLLVRRKRRRDEDLSSLERDLRSLSEPGKREKGGERGRSVRGSKFERKRTGDATHFEGKSASDFKTC